MHFMVQAGNYASSMVLLCGLLTKVDTIAPDALYGAKWSHLVQKNKPRLYHKKTLNYGNSIE